MINNTKRHLTFKYLVSLLISYQHTPGEICRFYPEDKFFVASIQHHRLPFAGECSDEAIQLRSG
jgi:hypothetical protein